MCVIVMPISQMRRHTEVKLLAEDFVEIPNSSLEIWLNNSNLQGEEESAFPVTAFGNRILILIPIMLSSNITFLEDFHRFPFKITPIFYTPDFLSTFSLLFSPEHLKLSNFPYSSLIYIICSCATLGKYYKGKKFCLSLL